MKRSELYALKSDIVNNRKYVFCYWENYNYSFLQNIMYVRRSGRGDRSTYDDCIIMFDTETSKKKKGEVYHNHVCAFTISVRAYHHNIVTLWGRRPDDCIKCMTRIMENLSGDKTIMYAHNMPYDYVFLRKFLMQSYGKPIRQLNVKSHYPISIEYNNGLILRDSLILSQCKLEKWADDLDVEHKKAVGKWDYDKIRNQNEHYTDDELEYIEHDTLAGVECIDKLMTNLNKKVYSMPYTATGIPREECYKRGVPNHAHDMFLKISPNYDIYEILEKVFHGGYTHANRHLIKEVIDTFVKCYDFTSSYPFCMIAKKFPMTTFQKFDDCKCDDILDHADNYAFMFKLILYKFKLKDEFESMPVLQHSKIENGINLVLDNGRILCGGYVEIYITEQDLDIIKRQYTWEKHLCTDVYYSVKDYLPRWFTDYVYELFKNKTMLKGGDPVDYALAKAKLNSLYGMCVQKAIQQDIVEDYETGDFTTKKQNKAELYKSKYIDNKRKILPYQWGVWVTAYALHNLFELFECVEPSEGYDHAIYTDTDSCYAHAWNESKLNAYNDKCKNELLANGYDAVRVNDKEYWLGVAVSEGVKDEYSQFRVQGAKRYCGRSLKDGELHITVAGVPKSGAKCLNDNIENFQKDFIFSGAVTGKKTHTYFFVDDIYTDENGNITGDSIDLSQCDYRLDDIDIFDFEKIFEEEIEVQTYE